MTKRGFTLIETLIYLALFAVIMSGILTAVYSISQTSSRNQAKAMMLEEGTFLVGKIDWILSNTRDIMGATGASSTLSVISFDGNVFVIDLLLGEMRLARDFNPPQALNNTNVSVENLTFVHTEATGDGINPESLEASFTLSTRTRDGLPFSQNFSTIKYLRK
ncbi:MAG: prepilin-type N-terminal cleavage/methylation domain-containing protein [Minisyncoccia bacterium]